MYHGIIRRKQPHHGLRQKLHQNDDQAGEAQGDGNGAAQGGLGPLRLSGADGAQMHGSHEEKVQTDVDNAGHSDEVHGTFAVPQSPEDGAEDVVGRNERDADEADREIGHGALHRLRRGGQKGYDGPPQAQQSGGQHQGKA